MDERLWRIVVEPRAKNSPAESITIAYLPDLESARIDAAAYVELIQMAGGIGSWAMDVAHHVPAAVVCRVGKGAWLVRVDSFEHETETGYDDGYGYLRIREMLV